MPVAVEPLPPDIRSRAEQLLANEREAAAIVEGLEEERKRGAVTGEARPPA